MEEDNNIDISNPILGSVRVRDDVLERYDIDTRTVYLRSPQVSTDVFLDDGSFYDDFGVRWRPASYYYDAIERPLANITSIKELEKAKWEDPSDVGKIAGVREAARYLYEETDFCLVADMHSWGSFEGGCVLRGYDRFLLDLFENPYLARALMERVNELAIQKWELFLHEVGEFVQVVSPDFIEEGADILNPVQRSAANMDIRQLKVEFGKEIAFWGGGIDIQQQLPYFSVSEVRDEVKRSIDILIPGGGFVFFPTHNSQPDISPEKIDALFEAVRAYC
jgi:uroporphyrinogen decarboxylase